MINLHFVNNHFLKGIEFILLVISISIGFLNLQSNWVKLYVMIIRELFISNHDQTFKQIFIQTIYFVSIFKHIYFIFFILKLLTSIMYTSLISPITLHHTIQPLIIISFAVVYLSFIIYWIRIYFGFCRLLDH